MEDVLAPFREANADGIEGGVKAFLSCFGASPFFEVSGEDVLWNDDRCHECRPEQILEVLQGALLLRQREDCTQLESRIADLVFARLHQYYRAVLLDQLDQLRDQYAKCAKGGK